MAYPGDQGKPGGWPHEQPSHAPRGGGDTGGDSPFPRRDDAFGGSAAPWGEDPAGGPLAAPSAPKAGPGGPGSGDPEEYGDPREYGGPGGPGGFGGPGGPGAPGEPGERGGFGEPGGLGVPGGRDFDGPGERGGPGGPGASYGPPVGDDDPYGDPQRFGMPEEHGGPAGPRPDRRGEPARPSKSRLPLIIGAAALAGLVLIGGGFAASSMLGDDEAKAGGPANAPAKQTPSTQPSPAQPTLEPVKLKNRATDPTPLTLREVFGKKSFTAGGQKYVRTGVHATRNCAKTVQGAKLTTVIRKGGCSQSLRATFARGDGKLIGTVGILNLKTDTAAKLAQRAAAAKDAFLQPLPGTGVSKTIGKGEALGTAEARGHYLLMTWVQRPDGKKIATKYHKVVSNFGQQLIRGSNLSFALHYRETEGKPFSN